MDRQSHNSSAWKTFLLHLHPPKVHSRSIRFTRTFGLGGIAALLFIILACSGMILRFKYIPSVVGAYDSLLTLEQEYIFGHFLRSLHYWSANLLIIVSFLHMIRVLFSQSIYGERKKNWIYGLFLFICILAFNFTGYLLPWDQLSYWAVTIVTSMLSYIPLIGEGLSEWVRGGEQVNESTLLSFYHLHTGILPLFFVCFVCIHFWLVRKAKGVTFVKNQGGEMLSSYPHLVHKEVVAALIVCLVLVLLSLLLDVPMLGKAHPDISPNPSKAPWYFIGFQELLIHFDPSIVVLFIPVITLSFLISLPFYKQEGLHVGVWFNSIRGSVAVKIAILVSLFWTTIYLALSELVLQSWSSEAGNNLVVSVINLLIYVAPLLVFVWGLSRRLKLPGTEIRLVFVAILLSSYIVMSIVAYFFRAEGMEFIF